MDPERYVEDTAEIVRIMAEEDKDLVRTALQHDPQARAALDRLVAQAEQVQDDEALLKLAGAIFDFVQQCPPLSERYMMPGKQLFLDQAVLADKQSTALAQQFAPAIYNHLREMRDSVTQPLGPDPVVPERHPPTPASDPADEGQAPPGAH